MTCVDPHNVQQSSRVSSRRMWCSLASQRTSSRSADGPRTGGTWREPVGTRRRGGRRRCRGEIVVRGHLLGATRARRTGAVAEAQLGTVDEVVLEGNALLGERFGGLRRTDVWITAVVVCSSGTTWAERALTTVTILVLPVFRGFPWSLLILIIDRRGPKFSRMISELLWIYSGVRAENLRAGSENMPNFVTFWSTL